MANTKNANLQHFTGEVWLYVGPGEFSMTKHIVLFASRDEVITWSLPDRLTSGGCSWLGCGEEFLRDFRSLTR